MYQPGELNQRVVVERLTVTRDDLGGQVEQWAKRCEIWVKVKPLGSSERASAGAISNSIGYTLIAYNRSDIKAEDRVIWGDYILNVVSPVPAGASDVFMQIDCELGIRS